MRLAGRAAVPYGARPHVAGPPQGGHCLACLQAPELPKLPAAPSLDFKMPEFKVGLCACACVCVGVSACCRASACRNHPLPGLHLQMPAPDASKLGGFTAPKLPSVNLDVSSAQAEQKASRFLLVGLHAARQYLFSSLALLFFAHPPANTHTNCSARHNRRSCRWTRTR